jgi:hypothetical protein
MLTPKAGTLTVALLAKLACLVKRQHIVSILKEVDLNQSLQVGQPY